MAKKTICPNCGDQGKPKLHTNGNLLIEIILWCCFIVPGLIYSLWRQSTKKPVCRQCGSFELVPVTTPGGKKLVEKFS